MRSDLENRKASNLRARPPSAEAPKTVNDLVRLRRPSSKGSCLIENVDVNKSGGSKLALEPQQMKKKKKGSDYNLMKSLAWDRAFFTEEGVLDPIELSIICGASLGGPPFIREDSPGGLSLPLNLVKEPEDEDLGKGRMNDVTSPMLNLSSSSFVASTALTPHKVSTCFGSKGNSRYGDCPQTLSLTSLKRPANVNAVKAAGKELKLSKTPNLIKSGLDSVAAKRQNTLLRANRVRQNQFTQPDCKTQANAGTKKLFEVPISAKLRSKTSSRQSANCSNGKSEYSSPKNHSSANVTPKLDEKSGSAVPKKIPGEMPHARFINSFGCADKPTTFAVPFSHNAQASGKMMHPLMNTTMKPSGLRMPSPSLSFFSQPETQPKALVPNRLSPIDAEPEIRGPETPGILRLQENLKRALYKNKSPGCKISSSEATNSASGCMNSHVTVVEFHKPDSGESCVKKQDLSKGNIAERLSDLEPGPQNGSPKQVADVNFFKKAVDNCSVRYIPVESKNIPVESGWTYSELNLEQNFGIPTPETWSEINKLDPGKKRCESLISNDGTIIGPECEHGFDCKVRSSFEATGDCEKSCTSSLHESEMGGSDPSKYYPDKINKSIYGDSLGTKERASEQLRKSQKNGRDFSGNASLHALKEIQANAENSDSGFRNCLKEADSMKVLNERILHEEVRKQNLIGALEISDDTKQYGAVLGVENIFLEAHAGINHNVEPTADGLSSEKHICLQNFQEVEDMDTRLPVFDNQKDRNEVNNSRKACSQPPGKVQGCCLDGYKILEPHMHKECISDESFSLPESHGSLIKMISNTDDIHNRRTSFDGSMDKRMRSVATLSGGAQDDKEVSSYESDGSQITGPNIENLLTDLHQEIHRITVDGGNSFPGSRTKVVSPNLCKTMDLRSYTRDGSENSFLTSAPPECNSNGLRNARNSVTVMVQSIECSFAQSGPLSSPTAKNSAAELCKDNEVQPMEDSVAGESELCLAILENSYIKSPLNQESCNDVTGHCGQLPINYATIDPSTFESFPDSTSIERSEDTNSSTSCPQPQLDFVEVEAALASNNKRGNTLMEKRSQSLAVPPNAIPFSDEWLAAIEAAGEEILTKKGGAVQNSPPDKSLPEPSPWSPVKKKHHIGPYDCTKFSNIEP